MSDEHDPSGRLRREGPGATVVREAIDLAFPAGDRERQQATDDVLAAEPMEVPGVAELVSELDELGGPRG